MHAGREELLRPREAALLLKISYPTIKKWIDHKKSKAVQTAGGHYRIPESEVDPFLYRARGRNSDDRRTGYRNVSGRNQLVGRIVDIRSSGLMAQLTLDVGGQLITSIIPSSAVHEMGLKKGPIGAALIKATEVMILRV
jgi:molybdopterin-binding protein